MAASSISLSQLAAHSSCIGSYLRNYCYQAFTLRTLIIVETAMPRQLCMDAAVGQPNFSRVTSMITEVTGF